MHLADRIGQFLHKRRLAQGFSRKNIAKAMGLSVSYVGLVERGMRVPSPPRLANWCMILGADAASIFSILALALSKGATREGAPSTTPATHAARERANGTLQLLSDVLELSRSRETGGDAED